MKTEHILHQNTPLDKTNSSFQKDVNRLRKKCHEYQKALEIKKVFQTQALDFIENMLIHGKVTKEDLQPYFKKKRDIIL